MTYVLYAFLAIIGIAVTAVIVACCVSLIKMFFEKD